MHVSREAFGVKTFPAAPRLADRMAIEPAAVLGAAEIVVPEKLAALEQWNEQPNVPTRNGFSRSIGGTLPVRIDQLQAFKGAPVGVAGGLMAKSDGGIVWSASIEVQHAYGLRLHLENVKLPQGAVLWVYGEGDTPTAFDQSLIDPHDAIWTPSTRGQVIHIEVEVPAGSDGASFDIREVMELVHLHPLLKPGTNDDPTCLVDVQCVTTGTWSPVTQVKSAIAQLVYVKTEDGLSYLCTGGLLNDQANSRTPWLLTANHCIHDQTAASSLEAHFDYEYVSCVSSEYPPLDTVPRSNGATLLVNSTSSDFSFMRLNAIPSGRVFLGWNASTSAVADGTRLYRVSHPAPSGVPYPEQFSTTVSNSALSSCSSWPHSSFLYSAFTSPTEGGVYGGSSGSLVMIASGQVVGQLAGGCTTGPNQDPSAGCDPRISTVDGAFSSTYSAISQYLAGTGGSPTVCVPDAKTACVLGGRFKVTVRYRAGFDNNAVDTDALKKSVTGFGSASYETAFFYFNSENNIELLLKILDQGNVDSQGHPTIAVLFGTATPLRIEVTVTDTRTGTVKQYASVFGSMQGKTDFTAFVK